MNKISGFNAILIAIIFTQFKTLGAFVVSPGVPNEGHASPGPFLYTQRDAPSIRYQELRSADEFGLFGSPILITEIAWARSLLGPPIDVTLSHVEIHFSTATRAPFEISHVFSENIGTDELTVFSGPLHLADTGGEFGIRIPLQNPFLYDPSRGSLLMDFWNYQTLSTSASGLYLEFAGGFVPSVWLTGAAGVTTPVSDSASTGGLFTRFTVTPVPEPSTWLLLTTGLAALAFARRKWDQSH